MANETVFNPTYYGPAPQGGSAEPVINAQTEGTLTCFVQQPVDGVYSKEDREWTLKVKGPWTHCLRVADDIDLGDTLQRAKQKFAPLQLIQRFSDPVSPDLTLPWLVTDVRVNQLPAGDHGELELKVSLFDRWNNQTTVLSTDPWTDTWDLQWQSYTVRPYAFADNTPHEDPSPVDFQKPNTKQAAQDSWKNGNASTEHIEQHCQSRYTRTDISSWAGHNLLVYENDNAETKVLNRAECLILDKKLKDKNALYHYPVLIHNSTKAKKTNLSSYNPSVIDLECDYDEIVGDDIDFIVGGASDPYKIPKGCPYSFPSNTWQWVKIGDNMTQTRSMNQNTKQITQAFNRKEMWMGVISADQNYYGREEFDRDKLETCRWEMGRL